MLLKGQFYGMYVSMCVCVKVCVFTAVKMEPSLVCMFAGLRTKVLLSL